MRCKDIGWVSVVLFCGVLAGALAPVMGQEHPTEHPKQTAPAKKAALTAEQLAQAITAYVASDAQMKGGYFLVYDTVAKKPLALTLDRVHQDRLSSLGSGVYFACADFKSIEGATYDVDVFMQEDKDGLKATEVHVHKVNGEPRYAWEEKAGVWVRREIR